MDNLDELDLAIPKRARSLFNRCTLPAAALGGLLYQRKPAPLALTGVLELHKTLFQTLELLDNPGQRAKLFMDYMDATFMLKNPEEMGYAPGGKKQRIKADYLRMLRGWLFNPDGREAAVLKGWVASRFGLLPRYHETQLDDYESEAYQNFLAMQSAGLYGTSALESQLDVLYHYCQYELKKRFGDEEEFWPLFRGVNAVDQYEVLAKAKKGRRVVLLNNLSSFSEERERADEFGDYILEAKIPLTKVFFYNHLLPGMLKGEEEVLVIGGLLEVRITTL
ncbi:NAD(+)--dinitrogen-reductase ADP-D-ribosyltransferase [Magnetofaba australis]|uniref:Putative NAD(+)--dinitrogen-reductase ADP-D-ribosyltransferase n=1 Tax=Magnetofaba australis IT-1 TaxID=1434232 RepID=A0A1Y2K3N7_9PROT|nr:NAD(+)--dinitrogen-reductase ADP-D-ribosyltransferase [Magnetofaba australis]OSM04005.1 putative NAD(+)--dinitrogen-reductase ADP-D-ribosyltransferase [Magnetofaba australis IT-1]